MGDFDEAFVRNLAVETWSFYSVGMFLIGLRIYARIHRLGVKGLQIDDYLMVGVAALYTTLIVCLDVIAQGGGSNLYVPEEYTTFTQHEIQDRIKGSKIVLISEQAMLNVIYTIKCCMLIMYSRLTLGLQVQRLVIYLGCYVAVGWFSTQIAFFTACRPFNGYWAMPPPNAQCTTLEHYALVQGCFNITSDLLMLGIPLPLITRLSVPLKQKVVLLVIFSMGIFVILAALLTKIFNLSNVWDPSYMLWYTREASVAVYVSNLPMIWPLLREWFPAISSLGPKHRSTSPRNRSSRSTWNSNRFRPISLLFNHLAFHGEKGRAENITSDLESVSKRESCVSPRTDPADAAKATLFYSYPQMSVHAATDASSHSLVPPTTTEAVAELPGISDPHPHRISSTPWNGSIHMTTTVHISREDVRAGGSAGTASESHDVEKNAILGMSWLGPPS